MYFSQPCSLFSYQARSLLPPTPRDEGLSSWPSQKLCSLLAEIWRVQKSYRLTNFYQFYHRFICVTNPSSQDGLLSQDPLGGEPSTYFQAGPNPHLETLPRHLHSTRPLASVPPQSFQHYILPFSLLDLKWQTPYSLPLSQ